MHLKIYFNDKPLFLCDHIDPVIEPYLHHDDAVFIDELNVHTVNTMIHEMQLEKVHAGVFLHADLAELKHDFYRKFELIRAGGGLVLNEKQEALLIFRRGKWDLPKGKQDEGESIEACAVREVQEETGIKTLTIEKPLPVTYHTYHQGARYILKESYWFLMHTKGVPALTPQSEEDISEARWVSKAAVPAYLQECFPSVKEILETWLAE